MLGLPQTALDNITALNGLCLALLGSLRQWFLVEGMGACVFSLPDSFQGLEQACLEVTPGHPLPTAPFGIFIFNYVHVHVICLQSGSVLEVKGGIRSPGVRLQNDCKPLDVGTGN